MPVPGGGLATRHAVPTATAAFARGRRDRPGPSTRNMPTDDIIRVWAEIQKITAILRRCEKSPCFVPGKGDVLAVDFWPEKELRALRAIFEVYGKQIEKELPEELRGVDWVELCKPTEYGVRTLAELMVSRVRVYQFKALHEVAAYLVEKYRALQLAAVDGPNTPSDAPPTGHSQDFRSVHYFGNDYVFTKMQAPIVKLLWEAREAGTPDVGAETLLETVDAKSSRLVDIFRGCTAWGTLIVDGKTKGAKRIADPPNS